MSLDTGYWIQDTRCHILYLASCIQYMPGYEIAFFSLRPLGADAEASRCSTLCSSFCPKACSTSTKYEKGYRFIAGVDEAGRGPLAGPVVAAAVILHRDVFIPGIDDSKKLSASRREALYGEIQQKAAGYGIGIVSEEIIDRINILRASLEAMKLAILRLPMEPDLVLIDGLHLPDIHLPAQALPHGDSLCLSIAAASILAKVTRDHIMCEFDRLYPEYGFARNKGYPTAEHLVALKRFGPCEIHRRSFNPVKQKLRQSELPNVDLLKT